MVDGVHSRGPEGRTTQVTDLLRDILLELRLMNKMWKENVIDDDTVTVDDLENKDE